MESIMNLQLEDELQVISIAKRLEEIYYPNDPIPLHINKKSDTLKVLQHLRNEAHRFGITSHRNKRDKNTLSTELQTIAGIGEATATELLRIFGSIKRIKQTEKIELEKAIGKAKAKLVFDYYHK